MTTRHTPTLLPLTHRAPITTPELLVLMEHCNELVAALLHAEYALSTGSPDIQRATLETVRAALAKV